MTKPAIIAVLSSALGFTQSVAVGPGTSAANLSLTNQTFAEPGAEPGEDTFVYKPRPVVSIRNFGAKCDGTDAAPAIRTALATGANVLIPACFGPEVNSYYLVNSFAGNYQQNSWVFILTRGTQDIYSDGQAALRMADGLVNSGGQMFGGGLFLLNRASRVKFSTFIIDMNGANNLVPSGTVRNAIAIKGVSSSHIELDRVTFLNPSGQNDVLFDNRSSYIRAHHLSMIGSGQCLSGNTWQRDWTALYSEAPHTDFSHNTIENCPSTGGYLSYPQGPAAGIEMHNSSNTGVDNDIDYGFPCVYLSGDSANVPATDVVYTGNHCRHAYTGIVFNQWTLNNGVIADNDIGLTPGAWPPSAQPSVGIYEINWSDPASNYTILNSCSITGNTIREDEANPPSVPLGTGMSFGAMHSCLVTGNTIRNISGYAVIFNGTGYGLTDTMFTHNQIANWGRNSSTNGHEAILLEFAGTNAGCTPPCTMYKDLRGLTISDNELKMDGPATPVSTAFYLRWDNDHSVIDDLDIHDNIFMNVTPLSGPSANVYDSSNAGYHRLQWNQ